MWLFATYRRASVMTTYVDFEKMSEIAAEMSIPTDIRKLEADMGRFQRIVEALDQKMGAVLRQYLWAISGRFASAMAEARPRGSSRGGQTGRDSLPSSSPLVPQ